MPATSTAASDLKTLQQLAAQTATLFTHYEASLRNNKTSSSSSTPAPSSAQSTGGTTAAALPEPLPVLHTSSTLLRAHVTKLGLLLANEPFTASAVTREVRGVNQCVSALLSAVEICTADKYGAFLRSEVTKGVLRCVVEVKRLLVCVETGAARAAAPAAGGGGGKKKGEDPIGVTGMVWEACDGLIGLAGLGIAGVAAKRAEEWRGLLIDAIGEFKEWSEEAEDEDEEDDEDEDEDEPVTSGDEDGFGDDILAAPNKLPKKDTGLREQLDKSIKLLRHIDLLYQAVIKRRLKVFPAPTAAQAANTPTTNNDGNLINLDQITQLIADIPDKVDDLAAAFYSLDSEAATELFDEVRTDALTLAEKAQKGWVEGQENDVFSAWVDKWNTTVGKEKP